MHSYYEQSEPTSHVDIKLELVAEVDRYICVHIQKLAHWNFDSACQKCFAKVLVLHVSQGKDMYSIPGCTIKTASLIPTN